MSGTLAILNVSKGDTKLSFDKDKPEERAYAARVVTDMLKRGYAIVIEVSPGVYERVKAFDPNTCEYLISDIPKETTAAPVRKRGRPRRRVDAATTSGVGVARAARHLPREVW